MGVGNLVLEMMPHVEASMDNIIAGLHRIVAGYLMEGGLSMPGK